MSAKQERARFARTHSGEAVAITVLTGTHAGGAGKAGGEVLWTASADVLAYVDEHGVFKADDGRLHWRATDEQRSDWIHDLKAHTQYVVRVRRRLPADPADYAQVPTMQVPDFSHTFALDEVIERDVHVPELDQRLAQYLLPVTHETDIGTFDLERSLSTFVGTFYWCGAEVTAHLDVDEDADEGTETCQVAVARLGSCVADDAALDATWRNYAATELLELSRDWQADSDDPDPAPITLESFVERIGLSSISVSTDGSMTAYYDDGDLFWGHVILIHIEPDDTLTDSGAGR